MHSCSDDPNTHPAMAHLSDQEILARMGEMQAQMAALQRMEEFLLKVIAWRDPELAAELSKQRMR